MVGKVVIEMRYVKMIEPTTFIVLQAPAEPF
jgi:hypothetical protein